MVYHAASSALLALVQPSAAPCKASSLQVIANHHPLCRQPSPHTTNATRQCGEARPRPRKDIDSFTLSSHESLSSTTPEGHCRSFVCHLAPARSGISPLTTFLEESFSVRTSIIVAQSDHCPCPLFPRHMLVGSKLATLVNTVASAIGSIASVGHSSCWQAHLQANLGARRSTSSVHQLFMLLVVLCSACIGIC